MKFKRNRRAISPIVAIILMFVLTMAAIGISLVYMYPSINGFKDKSYNNSNNLYFVALDATIQGLVNNPPPGDKQFYFNQDNGEISVDSSWLTYFILKDVTGAQNVLLFQENITRIVHRSTAVADYGEGEHRYIVGPENQDYMFLNGSSTLYNEIAIINATRSVYESSYLDLALYYRYVLSTQYITEGATEIYNLDIINLKFLLNETSIDRSTQQFVTMQLNYLGTEKQELEEISFINDIYSEVRVLNGVGFFQFEYPLYYPAHPGFISHLIRVNIINMLVSVTIT
ncbi:MAG: hypothetical protein KGD64_11845 [Candidatus Heimdallarchaeota archaeon]|nr:hypothetical protein [Candidatus Heimdallarchaeota archaeon]